MADYPKQRYNLSHPERNGSAFDQVLTQQSYTTASSIDKIAAEDLRDLAGKNVLSEYSANNVVLRDARTVYSGAAEEGRRAGTEPARMYPAFVKMCEDLHLQIPQNDQTVRDNLDAGKNPNQILAEQFVFALNADYAAQLGWKPGQPATPELTNWANDCYRFFIRHFGYKDPKTGERDERNVLCAALHLDEDAPHIQLLFVPVTDYVRKVRAAMEPSRDKQGNIKYYLKEDSPYYKTRHKYTPLVVDGKDMTDEIQRDDQGELRMKMHQVRKTTADGKGTYVDKSQGWETYHTGKPRIAHSDMWQEFLDDRRQALQERGTALPEEYLKRDKDPHGKDLIRVIMRPYNALQDVYQEEVAQKYGLARGRVGSHGKGERPSKLTAQEYKEREEQRAALAHQRAEEAEQEAPAILQAAQDKAREQAKPILDEARKRRDEANRAAEQQEQRNQQAAQDYEKRKQEQDKALQDERKKLQAQAKAEVENWKEEAESQAANTRLQASHDADRIRSDAQVDRENKEYIDHLAAALKQVQPDPETGQVAGQRPDPPGVYYELEKPLRKDPKKPKVKVPRELLEDARKELKWQSSRKLMTDTLQHQLDPDWVAAKTAEIYAEADKRVETVRAQASADTEQARRQERWARERAQKIEQTDKGQLVTQVEALQDEAQKRQENYNQLWNNYCEVVHDLGDSDAALSRKYEATRRREAQPDQDHQWAEQNPPVPMRDHRDGEAGPVSLFRPGDRKAVWEAMDDHDKRQERRIGVQTGRADRAESLIQRMKDLAAKVDQAIFERLPKTYRWLHKLFPELRETFGLDDLEQRQREEQERQIQAERERARQEAERLRKRKKEDEWEL